MEEYYIVTIPINEIDESFVSECARDNFRCTGVEEFSLDEPRVDELLGERSYSGADIPHEVIHEVEVITKEVDAQNKYYFDDRTNALAFIAWLKSQLGMDVELETFQQQDWNENWRKNFQRIDVSANLSIVPAWEKPDRPLKNELYIYPGMGFGTGNHETTFLCLKLFEKIKSHIDSSFKCLDVGCGSGILGLAYRKFFEGPVVLYDVDHDALVNCEQNIELNEFSQSQIRMCLPQEKPQISNEKYELVFANILQNILIQEAPFILGCMEKNSFLILSGLLNGQEDLVIKTYCEKDSHIKVKEIINKGDWVALLLEKS